MASSARPSNHRHGMILSLMASLRWGAHGPEHAERIAQLSPAVTPEHDLQRRHDLEAGRHRPVPPGLDIIDLEVEGVALVRLESAAVLRIRIREHEGAAVDVQVHV